MLIVGNSLITTFLSYFELYRIYCSPKENRNLTFSHFFDIINRILYYLYVEWRIKEVLMKKYLFFISLLLTVTFAVNAADILVWNFNPGNYDEYTDPEAGQQINCGYWLKECLTNNGYTFTYHDNTKLPADISSYDVVVATVGYYEC